mmetsp:Transcript_14534/g.31577  ORF Transcript_14534/g.31577 Transcript_14534/m.31577 type:complete len:310 (+) Transcript_14534:899-1828(+)
MKQIIHGSGRILPIRIGKQKHLHPRITKFTQHGKQSIIQYQILFRIPGHFILDHSIPVAQVNAFPYLAKNLCVRLAIQEFMLSKVFQLDQRCEQVSIDMLKQRVHVDECLLGKRGDLIERARIQVFPHVTRNRLKSMICHSNILVSINLEEVTPLRINNQSTDPVRMIILEIKYFFGITQRVYQFLLGSVKCQLVKLRLAILRESVIHVETNSSKVVKAELTVAKYIVGGNGTIGWQIFQGIEGEVHFVEKGGEAVVARVAIDFAIDTVGVDDRGRFTIDDGRFRKRLFGAFIRVNFVRRRRSIRKCAE